MTDEPHDPEWLRRRARILWLTRQWRSQTGNWEGYSRNDERDLFAYIRHLERRLEHSRDDST